MTREEAKRRISELPAYIPGPCPTCSAVTLEEAGEKCTPWQLPCGEYECGTPEDAPETDGLIHIRNPEYAELEGYLWEWFAFDEGLTSVTPKWKHEP